jgi:hypothetical protein
MVALSSLPPVRAATGRPGRTVNRARSANIEAELAQIVGTINATLCSYCVSGSGPWALCVSVAGRLSGSYTVGTMVTLGIE